MCTPTQKKHCQNEDCDLCMKRSFINSKRFKQYSSINKEDPRFIFLTGNKKYWFDCDNCDHSFEKSLSNISAGKWCPYCCSPPKNLCKKEENCKSCFEKSFASSDFVDWFHPTKNPFTPHDVFKTSTKLCWFNCKFCGHDFKTKVLTFKKVKDRKSCPYCSSQYMCEDDDCDLCFNRSLESVENLDIFLDCNSVRLRDVFKNSNVKYWFQCRNCDHKYCTSPNNINIFSKKSTGSRCPYCAHLELCKDDCDICFNNSFKSHYRIKDWCYIRNEEDPRFVFKCTSKYYWLKCDKCPHYFQQCLSNVVYYDSWCPYCANQKLCEDDDCIVCFNKSFASHWRAKYWLSKNKLTPRQVFKNSNFKYWFYCTDCNKDFQKQLNCINGKNGWCGCTINKTEAMLYDHLSTIFPDVEKEVTPIWCIDPKKRGRIRYDFIIESLNLIIELDGKQHFIPVPGWKSLPENVQKRDKEKMKLANDNGYTVIRLLQKDVFHNKNNWNKELDECLYLYDEPTQVFICSNDEYLPYY